MALTEERFKADGTTRIFTPATTILSQNHCRVDYYLESDIDNIIYITPDEWDLINNSIIFKEPPELGKIILISISTTGEDLDEPSSDIQIVASIKDEIKEVVTFKDEIVTEARLGMLIHTTEIKDDFTLKQGYNSVSVGPIVVGEDVNVEIEDGSRWYIL
jgi:hypothetical protein